MPGLTAKVRGQPQKADCTCRTFVLLPVSRLCALHTMHVALVKVFRTYNASITLQKQLKATPVDGTIEEKMLAYQRANRQVAILCNHQVCCATLEDGHSVLKHAVATRAYDPTRSPTCCQSLLIPLPPKPACCAQDARSTDGTHGRSDRQNQEGAGRGKEGAKETQGRGAMLQQMWLLIFASLISLWPPMHISAARV